MDCCIPSWPFKAAVTLRWTIRTLPPTAVRTFLRLPPKALCSGFSGTPARKMRRSIVQDDTTFLYFMNEVPV